MGVTPGAVEGSADMRRRRTRGGFPFLILLLAVAAAGGLFSLWWWSAWRLEHSQDARILEAATRYAIDPTLVKAVMWKESRFNPRARGRAGEIGLMQLMDPAAQEWAETVRAYPLPESALYDPRTNVLAGAWYLRKLLQRYRDTDNATRYALADYNAGRGNVLKWARGPGQTNSATFLTQIGYPSTRDYVDAVMRRWDHYQRRGDFPAAGPR